MNSQKAVGREFLEKSAEGADVPETAFGSQANQRVVPYRFQQIDVVRINGYAAELGDINKDPTRPIRLIAVPFSMAAVLWNRLRL